VRSPFVFAVLMLCCVRSQAAQLSEGFENVPGLFSSGGWVQINRSNPVGPATYLQGGASLSPAQSGPANSFAVVNFASTGSPDGSSGSGTISNWAITPTLVYDNGDQIKFWTRSGGLFPDRLELRFSANGASNDVGATEFSVGDFFTLLLTINPDLQAGGYPTPWTQFTATITGLPSPTSGRVAFRYFVTNGGPDGGNSNIIGLDTLSITPTPEPAAIALPAMVALASLTRRPHATPSRKTSSHVQ
jgi:hypothetical protein